MVKVLVWNSKTDKASGFWAEFEGEEVSSYEGGDVVYTLYRCTAYKGPERYRVHISNEAEPSTPVYKLRPYEEPRYSGQPPNYEEPWFEENVAKEYPRFLKDLSYFETHPIDAKPTPRR